MIILVYNFLTVILAKLVVRLVRLHVKVAFSSIPRVEQLVQQSLNQAQVKLLSRMWSCAKLSVVGMHGIINAAGPGKNI